MHWFLFHSLLPPTSITTNSCSLSISFKAQQNWQDAPNDLFSAPEQNAQNAHSSKQNTDNKWSCGDRAINEHNQNIINTANAIVPQMGEICITVNNEWWIDFSSLSLMFRLCLWPTGKQRNHISSKHAQRKARFSWLLKTQHARWMLLVWLINTQNCLHYIHVHIVNSSWCSITSNVVLWHIPNCVFFLSSPYPNSLWLLILAVGTATHLMGFWTVKTSGSTLNRMSKISECSLFTLSHTSSVLQSYI